MRLTYRSGALFQVTVHSRLCRAVQGSTDGFLEGIEGLLGIDKK
jgi:hypothetical protein